MSSVRRLLALTLLLTVLITTTSAYIRVTQTRVLCADLSACDGTPAAESTEALSADSPIGVARGLHRIAASTLGILLIAVVLTGWKRWSMASERTAGLALLVVAGALAWLGKYTPSPLPAVTLANLLGGMALLALLAWLWESAGRGAATPGPGGLRLWTLLALALLFLEIAVGGLVSVRLSAPACPALDCAGTFPASGIDWSGFDVFRANAELGDASRQTVQVSHRFVALITVMVLAWTGWRHARAGWAQQAPGLALLALSAMQLALGSAMLLAGLPASLTVLHNVVSALSLVIVVSLLVRMRHAKEFA